MLLTASDLEYAPSTLTFIRLALDASKGDLDVRKYPVLRGPLAKLPLLAQKGNPDALTLAGELALRKNDIPGALLKFNQAIKAAATQGDGAFAPAPTRMDIISGRHLEPPQRKPRWAMESRCHIQRGRLLLERGDRADAEAAFRIAATELDVATGCLELAKLLPVGSSDRESYLLKAIASGITEAHSLLMLDLSKGKPTDSLLWGGDQREDQKWINELHRMAK